MRDITGRQLTALTYIHNKVRETGVPPTIREVAVAMGIRSTQGGVSHLRALTAKGLITREPRSQRGIALTAAGRHTLQCPRSLSDTARIDGLEKMVKARGNEGCGSELKMYVSYEGEYCIQDPGVDAAGSSIREVIDAALEQRSQAETGESAHRESAGRSWDRGNAKFVPDREVVK